MKQKIALERKKLGKQINGKYNDIGVPLKINKISL
jgi:hypothetical protein